MLLVRAIVRPEKRDEVLYELSTAGFHAATVIDVMGRGKQKGIKIGSIVYDEIPKVMILMAVRDEDKDDVVSVIMRAAKTSDSGAFGDGKIFITPIEEAYTVSSAATGL
ncbi:P-II family nitrogen regulator [Anaeromusa sp.]|jgi:nitrogen regulatory protein PII 1|uniref:P-II family nitrogen regulator n=1 Tax=Anaeromusa sp. TaxID=1872520 RepID=UPI00262BFDA6|nr:P-II family nitrogen regulator [Anaeromusa sp.]MDD3158071.1 P-II family nitrogen regulator [Anaeromusa sp.]MEA4834702.1 P-II family nitrogen regulator [Anaeromusa sp.]NCB77883.1 P-II family nitrogen regulator [Negativicutes bacterium]